MRSVTMRPVRGRGVHAGARLSAPYTRTCSRAEAARAAARNTIPVNTVVWYYLARMVIASGLHRAAGVAAVVALAVCGSRRRLALALALLSAVVGVDAAVHSVHHLNDPGAAATCVLASGTTHAPAVLSDGVIVAVAPTLVRDAYADVAALRADVRSSRPDRGRAPPSSAA